ncbi:MAG: LamG domain-containing protein [Sedimentisphaerales bacterium]|nr:LamG domain-containing protein [Sedimentisphaerales bacterium]
MNRVSILELGLVMLLASAAAGTQPVTLDTDPNLAAWWKLDEAAGKTAADSTVHKHDGTLQGDLSFDQSSSPGKSKEAIQLDGKQSWIEVKGYKGIAGTRPRTVAAWIKTTVARGEIVSWGTEDFGQMFIVGHIRGRIGTTPDGGYLYMNAQTNDDKWHHVAVVVREAELPNLHDDVTLYLDGRPAEIHDIGLLDLWPIQTGNKLDVRIGRGFAGLLDDLRIYDRPLSDDQVKALFELRTDQPLAKRP